MALARSISYAPITILTGAGASMPLGLPSTYNFHEQFTEKYVPTFMSQEMIDLWSNLSRPIGDTDERADAESIITDLEKSLNAAATLTSDTRSSRWFSGRNSEVIRSLELFVTTCTQLNEKLRDAIVEIYSSVPRGKAGELYRELLARHVAWFKGVYGIDDSIVIPIFTTNYDLAIEQACEELNIPYIDGFSRRTLINNVLNTELFAKFEPERGENNVVMFKLHGSVNWGETSGSIVLTNVLRRNTYPYTSVILFPTLGSKLVDIEPYKSYYGFFEDKLRWSMGMGKL